ncbi:MAG: HAD hydrolase family protein [Sinobacteraceae bacterium]|nr:HAD hydrolase family protein [Nevskiaceae bacterium]
MSPNIHVDIPGRGTLRLRHLLLDFNGTLARDGYLIRGVGQRLERLRKKLWIEVLTADTFGTARRALARSGVPVTIVGSGADKLARLRALGADGVTAIGNGRNDLAMFKAAALSICVVGPEGACTETLAAADLAAPDIATALDLLLYPERLIASLRE